MDDLLNQLRQFDALRDRQEDPSKCDRLKTGCTDSIEPEFGDGLALERLHPDVAGLVKNSGIDRLYRHQEEAILAALDGQDVVLESPTASGKTLSFALPMLDMLTKENGSHALMLYPMKALANDQRRQLQDLKIKEELGIDSWLSDGDTDREHRKVLKNNPPHILMTNAESLHLSFLGWQGQWEKFLTNLKYIVVDEIHGYRGYFGTNFAFLMRRFLLVLKQKCIEPQLFLSTATCANPKEHAQNLTGRKNFKLVSPGKNIAPKRHFAFIDPSIPDYNYYYIFSLRIANAGLACLSKGRSTLVFCPTRKLAEECFKTAQKRADEHQLNPDEIVPYRSGYTPDERREIEEGLRSGKYKLVFSTNALELGIDVGKLDGVILAGFPDSVLSAWQRIGRAGRSWTQDAFVVFYAWNNAYDQFYAENIDTFINKPLDEITVGVNNKEIMERHLPSLLHESAWKLDKSARAILGDTFYELAADKMKNSSPIGNSKPPHIGLNMRGGSFSVYKMICHDKEIGTMSDALMFKEAYIGAIYRHISNTYKVVAHGDNKIILEECEPHLVSKPAFFTQIIQEEIRDGFRFDKTISVFYGRVTIIDNFLGYKLFDDRDSSETPIKEEKHGSAKTLKVHAFWVKVENEEFSESALRAVENMFRIGSIFVIPADRHDTNTHCVQKEATVYFYENYIGGIGIAEKALTKWKDILKEGIRIAENCVCEKGCPKCILPPRFKEAGLIDKREGLVLAKSITALDGIKADERFDPTTHGWKKI